MIKLILVVVVGICSISCSTETITNTTTTTNNYYYGTKADKVDTLYKADPWIDKDTIITIGG